MQSVAQIGAASKGRFWTGWILTGLPALLLLLDGVMKLVKPAFVVDANLKLGYPENTILPIGVVLLACTILYLIPRTAFWGAILLTGYLGGAVATHVRVADGLFPIVFAIVIAALIWGGLYLRDERLRELV
jgi:hypothetical protein